MQCPTVKLVDVATMQCIAAEGGVSSSAFRLAAFTCETCSLVICEQCASICHGTHTVVKQASSEAEMCCCQERGACQVQTVNRHGMFRYVTAVRSVCVWLGSPVCVCVCVSIFREGSATLPSPEAFRTLCVCVCVCIFFPPPLHVVCESLLQQHTKFLTMILALTHTSGAAHRRPFQRDVRVVPHIRQGSPDPRCASTACPFPQ